MDEGQELVNKGEGMIGRVERLKKSAVFTPTFCFKVWNMLQAEDFLSD